ncbi:MAG TPA: tRNA epoxyqueuosine(34) reductase QueG [Bacteroidales bacterium]|nr:tRNA epoxyqueuosine(34) reductase QueG [Bacteroidales bacterium]
MKSPELSLEIKKKILDTGASDCGFARAEKLQREYDFLKQWLAKGFHAGRDYLERTAESRGNPELVVPGAKTVIAALYNYYLPDTLSQKQCYRISRYAFGRDYHMVIKERLESVAVFIRQVTESHNTRVFVDTAAVFEKAWAQRAGLGWIGKNSLLVNKKSGSFHFIGLIITDAELQYDVPVEEQCGNCNLCVEACPTGALVGPHELDIHKCITGMTMDQKNPLPAERRSQFGAFIYGCDICQEACPWNKGLKPNDDKYFQISGSLKKMSAAEWENLSEERFIEITEHSAMKKISFSTLKRNIDFIRMGKINHSDNTP